MKNKKIPKATLPGHGSPGFAVASGDEFCSMAYAFIKNMPTDASEAAKLALEHPGAVIASATNIALGIELLLKALLVYYSVPVPHTHELPNLFKALPKNVAESIINDYKALEKDDGMGIAAIEIISSEVKLEDRNLDVSDHSFSAVMQRNSNAFVLWRYAFESIRGVGGFVLRYEYASLLRIARALRAQFGPVLVDKNISQSEYSVQK